MTFALSQTVQDWRARGYGGLRIPRCPICGHSTNQTWKDLDASPDEDVIEPARRVRCQDCGQVPAGLAVVGYDAIEE